MLHLFTGGNIAMTKNERLTEIILTVGLVTSIILIMIFHRPVKEKEPSNIVGRFIYSIVDTVSPKYYAVCKDPSNGNILFKGDLDDYNKIGVVGASCISIKIKRNDYGHYTMPSSVIQDVTSDDKISKKDGYL